MILFRQLETFLLVTFNDPVTIYDGVNFLMFQNCQFDGGLFLDACIQYQGGHSLSSVYGSTGSTVYDQYNFVIIGSFFNNTGISFLLISQFFLLHAFIHSQGFVYP